MNTVKQVEELIAKQMAAGIQPQLVAWNAAKACVGWPYVYGAVGENCKPAKRSQYGTKFYKKGHETIVTKCKAISWDAESQTCKVTGNCSGCKWNLPVMMFDCRGFTRKILQMVFSWTLWGGTVGGQWNDERNWKAKGSIADGMPKDTLCCLFVYSDKKWKHTGFGFNDETTECSSGVQHFDTRNKKWTHWAVPKCIDGDVPTPTPTPTPTPAPTPDPYKRPTIRKGNRNQYVKELQTDLDRLGYNLGICGIDGDFGTATEKAVKEFQRDHGLSQDGICGPKTWTALIDAVDRLKPQPESAKTYTLIISGLDRTQAEAIKAVAANYPDAKIKEE